MIDAARADAVIGRSFLAWRAPERKRLSQWADQKFYLSAESAAEPGRWRSIPYQVGILDAFTDPDVEHVAVMKSARVGYTKCINAVIGYHIDEDPCPVMVVQPTIDDAQGYSKEEIAPMLRDCPSLAAKVPEAKTRDSENTILSKRFPGGSLSMVGANSPRGFRRVSRRVVLFDETDGYPPSAGSEGDQIALGIRRTEYYWNRKIGAGSTPTIAGVSRIERLFYEGDQRRYYVPCPHCGTFQVLRFGGFKWPAGKPEQAVYVCVGCGAEIEHVHKPAMVAAGEWRPGPHPQFPEDPAPGPFNGRASFHIWAAYSYSPNASWGQLCAEFVAATKAGPESLKTFVNTVLGEPWREKGEAPEWQRLYDRRELYKSGTCPRGVLFLTAGVDVQKDRLVYEVVGWGRGKVSWSIDYNVIPGDTATAAPWKGLEALLDRKFPHAGGGLLGVSVLAVDSGFNTQNVYAWCRRFPMSRVIAVRGVSTAHLLIGTPSRVDVTVSGRKLKRGYKVWPVASHVAKSELYGWLSLDRPTGDEPAPPGFLHFPEYADEWFKQLTAEQLVSSKSRKGYTVISWEVIPGRENHALDARVYARAAAAVAGLDRFTDGDFDKCEAALGLDAPPAAAGPDTPASVAAAHEGRQGGQAPASSAPAAKGTQAPPRQWLKPRGGGWLKRR